MLDLYAINIHLLQRLERNWRGNVRAPEAAPTWLDEASVLHNRKNDLPLCQLLRTSQRSNGKCFGIHSVRMEPDRIEEVMAASRAANQMEAQA